ncbi:MAG: glutamate cyclase domain-containing protein [Chloroflexota bacterium]|nr:glutamate cyclase domain-containing protein [Chloroflexota bacterium]MED6295947.1 glutamate cyclase domain-containing protein [Chloroflexota bacterium]
MTLDELILSQDKRGISKLKDSLPENFCLDAAQFVLDNPGKVFIVTGFYILSAKAAETDGPPGAVAIGNALEELGYEVIYVTDTHCTKMLEAISTPNSKIIEFPIVNQSISTQTAEQILKEEKPDLLISIERCAPATDGRYRNMRDMEITNQTAKIDLLFENHSATVGIGDGGNEIGLGNLYAEVNKSEDLVGFPAKTKVSKLIISSVSNWGGYGLVAALSVLKNKNLLLSVEDDTANIQKIVSMGAVDGFSGENINKVDGFTLDENSAFLKELHALIANK